MVNHTPTDLLDLSLTFYNQIQTEIIKQNVASFLWHTIIRSRIVTLTQLIDQIGKIPKDRLCYIELRPSEKDFSRTTLEELLRSIHRIDLQSTE